MSVKSESRGDIEFKNYLDGLAFEKKHDVVKTINGLDLNTPAGVETAKQLLIEHLDLRFNNASEIAGEAISTILKIVQGNTESEERKVLYRRRIGPKEYVIIEPPVELLESYAKEIDNIIVILKTGDEEKIASLLVAGVKDGNGSTSGSSGERKSASAKHEAKTRGDIAWIMDQLQSSEMSERRYSILAIAILTGINRSRGLTTHGTILKIMKAGRYAAENILEKDGEATCIDVAVLNKELAKQRGIQANVYTVGGKRTGHRFLVTDTEEVIDGWSSLLFYPSLEEFKKNYRNARIELERYDVEL